MDIVKGEVAYALTEYNLEKVLVLGVGPKNARVQYPNGYTRSVKLEKMAHPQESVAVVWEMWKGKNGRGGYRLEKELYPQHRKSAQSWPYQRRVAESSFGVENQRLSWL